MSKSLTIKEIRDKKAKAQGKITDILNKLMEETDINIENVELLRSSDVGPAMNWNKMAYILLHMGI